MINFLGRPSTLFSSFVFVCVMFVVVMFYANPMIDGGDGSGLLSLQLAFYREAGEAIVSRWGDKGVDNFKAWIFLDYIYAVAYSLFLASLLSFLALKNARRLKYENLIIGLSFSAGVLDCVENTIEVFFVDNPSGFPEVVFFAHSVFALIKWMFVFIVLLNIIYLGFKVGFYSIKRRLW